MVSTDAAARGIDIPNVTHVIQADFAASAVDFLHRVGHLHNLHAQANMSSSLFGVMFASEASWWHELHSAKQAASHNCPETA